MDKQEAVESLVKGFQSLPTSWLAKVAEALGHECFNHPVHGVCWRVTQTVDAEVILRLLRPIPPDEYYDEGDEYSDAALAASGWEEVGDTGLHATEMDGWLVLGINSGGGDFYADYWEPLYDAMGYQWHREEEGQHEAE